MLLEIVTATAAFSLAGYSYLKSNNEISVNDAQKINRIFNNCGLTIKEGMKTKTIRLHAKREIMGGMEYVYQLPLGLSSEKVMSQQKTLEDGLNTKSTNINVTLKDIMKIKWDHTALKQLKKLFSEKERQKKEIDISFDGMLKIRIYEEKATDNFNWEEALLRKGTWKVPMGATKEHEKIYHDFDQTKHLIIAGATGYGKSVMLKLIVTSLILQMENHVKLHLFDLKGGAAFARFKDCKQVLDFSREPGDTLKKLRVIQEGMNKTFNKIVDDGFEDVKEAGIKDRHFIIIDEAADLADNQDTMDIITDIARRGRSAGYYLVFCTQYPTSQVIPMQTKRNVIARLCYSVDSDTASRVVLDEEGANKIGDFPGRAIYKAGIKRWAIMSPYITNDQIKERIAPHIVIKPREDEKQHGQTSNETTEDRKYSFEFEESGLSNQGANSKAAWTGGRQKRK